MCTPDGDERCGDNGEYAWDGMTCQKIEDVATDSDTTQTAIDASTDSGDPVGLGEPCTEAGGECAELEASYCTASSHSPDGYCTIQDCLTKPDDCPPDYLCCDFDDAISDGPNFCAQDENYATLADLGLCTSE